MKSTPNHIIHKQTLDIRFRNFTTLHAWNADHQRKTAEAVRNSIEQCLKEYDTVKEYLTIDRLEIDLGVFSTGEISSEMPEKLYHELQKILGSYHGNMNNFEDAEIIPDTTGERLSFVKNSEVAAFLFFLQNGYLPWWCSIEPTLDQEWLQKLTEENWQELQNFLITYKENDIYYDRALSRLISQFSDKFLVSLLTGLQLREPIEKAWNLLTHFYEVVKKGALDSSQNEGPFPSLAVIRQYFWKKLIRYAADRSTGPELFKLFKIAGSNEWMDNDPEFWRNELINLRQEKNKDKHVSMPGGEIGNQTESKKLKEPEKANNIIKEDFILIPDAGLALLHPFLPELFEYCNLLKENDFVNNEARNRAVYLLHYLASGNEESPEYILMLPKLLCGIQLETPIELVQPLTDAEKAACDELLTQAIGHWKALQNTSPSGLRDTFLYRQGKLFLADVGWRLEVQRRTEDILLNRLPWGFSMIKYSWMPLWLSVSWE